MDNLVIETNELSKRYGRVTAVDGLSLQVPRGHVFGLLGPNGSGKTTAMSMLLGLVKPTSGGFRLFGTGQPHREALRRIGAIIETPSFYPYLSGRRNLEYFQGVSGKGDRRELDELLDKVSLLQRANDRYQTYSLGMKQRLGIAYALLGDPELLFLDEPTNGMDPAGMAEIRDIIKQLGSEGANDSSVQPLAARGRVGVRQRSDSRQREAHRSRKRGGPCASPRAGPIAHHRKRASAPDSDIFGLGPRGGRRERPPCSHGSGRAVMGVDCSIEQIASLRDGDVAAADFLGGVFPGRYG